uniref:MARVEL domain-containing protein n=1 Tax=Echinostoma caproni TaxID=27848 RepID=A0A183A640_9TREM
LQLIAIVFVLVIVITVATILILTWQYPFDWHLRAGSYTTAATGGILWFSGFLYFISVILVFHSWDVENHVLRDDLLVTRSAWNKISSTLLEVTRFTYGVAPLLATIAWLCVNVASVLFLSASTLIKLPKDELHGNGRVH